MNSPKRLGPPEKTGGPKSHIQHVPHVPDTARAFSINPWADADHFHKSPWRESCHFPHE